MTIKYLLTILISTITLTLSAQIDTLYVWAESGLLLRDKPNADGKVVGKLDYGDTVVVKSIPRKSEYSYVVFKKRKIFNSYSAEFKLNGNFLEVAVGDSSAYAFNGYLSKLLPVLITEFDDGSRKREHWHEYFNRTLGTINKIERKKYGEKITKTIYTDGTILREISSESYGSESLMVTDLTDNEIYLLIQGIYGIESHAKNLPDLYYAINNSNSDMFFLLGELCELKVKKEGGFIIISLACSC